MKQIKISAVFLVACASLLLTQQVSAQNAWHKIKTTSFTANSSTSFAQFIVPTPVTPAQRIKFNDSDTDDTGEVQYLVGDTSGGINAGMVIGPDLSNVSTSLSTTGWKQLAYSIPKQWDIKKLTDYSVARKTTKTITSLGEMDKNTVNILSPSTPLVIDAYMASQFLREGSDFGPYVLIINGDTTITSNINARLSPPYNPIPLAILVNGTLTISDSPENIPVSLINAIVIAKNVVITQTITADYTLQGLKFKGNLIATDTLVNQRTRTQFERPTLFIVQDLNFYSSLLPLLSYTDYEWK